MAVQILDQNLQSTESSPHLLKWLGTQHLNSFSSSGINRQSKRQSCSWRPTSLQSFPNTW